MQPKHGRSASHGKKVLPLHARPTRPTAVTRKSYNRTQSNNAAKKAAADARLEEDDDMASFLQFCATCETQIVTPSFSILYCSEACRKKDTNKPNSTPHSPYLSPTSATDGPPTDILPQFSPTVLRPASLTFSDLTISDTSETDDMHPFYLNRDRDSTAYLEQLAGTWTPESTLLSKPRAPTRANTLNDAASNVPSLTHTPSSSISTVASQPPQQHHSARPLPSRHNPSYSSFSTKPIDLAPPAPTITTTSATASGSPHLLTHDASLKSCASTLTAFRVVEGSDFSYSSYGDDEEQARLRRKAARNQARRDSGGVRPQLNKLFSHEAVRAGPSVREEGSVVY